MIFLAAAAPQSPPQDSRTHRPPIGKALSGTKKKTGKKAKRKLRWPRLAPPARRKAKTWIYELAHKDPLVVRKCEEELKSLGPGVLPFLLSGMSDSLPLRNPSLERVALAVVTKKEAPLLAPYLFHHLASVRRLASGLLVKAGDPAVLPSLRKALAAEKDPKVREGVVLALCALRDPAGLPGLFALARKDFFGRRKVILAAAGKLKGKKATRWLLKKLAGKDRKDKITALRLLAPAGTREAVPAVVPYLDSKNHALALEAINTLRSLVDGKKPMKHIGVFQLIQLRKEWKARLGGPGRRAGR